MRRFARAKAIVLVVLLAVPFAGAAPDLGTEPPAAPTALMPATAYSTSFEGSTSEWTFTGLWNVQGDTCGTPTTGTRMLGYNNRPNSCTYSTGSANSGDAIFSADLTGLGSPRLSFKTQWHVEHGRDDRDVVSVEARATGSSTWTLLM